MASPLAQPSFRSVSAASLRGLVEPLIAFFGTRVVANRDRTIALLRDFAGEGSRAEVACLARAIELGIPGEMATGHAYGADTVAAAAQRLRADGGLEAPVAQLTAEAWAAVLRAHDPGVRETAKLEDDTHDRTQPVLDETQPVRDETKPIPQPLPKPVRVPRPWLVGGGVAALALVGWLGIVPAMRDRAAHGEYDQGMAALRASATALAESHFRRAVDLSPRFVDAWYELGTAENRQSKYSGATDAEQHAIALKDDDYPAWGQLAYAQYYSSHYPDALTSALKAANGGNEDVGWEIACRDAWFHTNGVDDAYRYCATAVQHVKDDSSVWDARGWSIVAKKLTGEYATAVDAFNQALSIEHNKYGDAWRGLGEAQYGRGDYYDAISALQTAYQQTTDTSARSSINEWLSSARKNWAGMFPSRLYRYAAVNGWFVPDNDLPGIFGYAVGRTCNADGTVDQQFKFYNDYSRRFHNEPGVRHELSHGNWGAYGWGDRGYLDPGRVSRIFTLRVAGKCFTNAQITMSFRQVRFGNDTGPYVIP